jgi:hypothetical protein
MSRQSARRIYLEVPFPANKSAKRLGTHWDKAAGAWYVPAGEDPAPFLERWPRIEGDPAMQRPAEMSSDHHDADGKLLAAKIMGRLGGIAGGSKGGKARAQALSPERRKEIALMGVRAREQKRAMKRAAKALQDQERRSVLPDSPFWTDGENPDADDSDVLEVGRLC